MSRIGLAGSRGKLDKSRDRLLMEKSRERLPPTHRSMTKLTGYSSNVGSGGGTSGATAAAVQNVTAATSSGPNAAAAGFDSRMGKLALRMRR